VSFGAATFVHSTDTFFVEITLSGLALFYGIRASAAAIFEACWVIVRAAGLD